MIFPVSYCKTFCYEQTDTGSERDLDRRLFMWTRASFARQMMAKTDEYIEDVAQSILMVARSCSRSTLSNARVQLSLAAQYHIVRPAECV
jgi:hypothetical protein